MQRVPIPIPAVSLGTVATSIYTATPGITASTIGNMSFSNNDTVPVTFTAYNVPSGGTAGVTNVVVPPFTLSAGQNYVPPQLIGLSIAAGASIQASATVASMVNAQGGAYETSGS
jgi:hypothetical protein